MASASEERLEFVLQPTGHQPGPDTDQGCVDRGYAALTTLVGVVEAWPQASAAQDPVPEFFETHQVPGADLHPVHEVPDATDHRLLRRPDLGIEHPAADQA